MKKILMPLLVLVILLSLASVAYAQTGKGWFRVDGLWAESDIRAQGDLQVDDDTVLGDALSVAGDASLSAQLTIAPQTAISLTNGGVITPTGTIQLLTSSAAVTPTMAAGASGDIVTLINTADVAITIEDTTGHIFSGNIVLGQWDSATLVFYDASWVQVAESDN